MNILNIIPLGIISFFIFFIIQKREKQLSDYLLIGINLLFASFMIAAIWVEKSLTPVSFLFQSIPPFLLFPLFMSYAMLLTEKRQRLHRSWWWFWVYAVSFTAFIVLDFVILQDYDATSLRALYEDPPLSYHFFYKTNKIFIAIGLLWLLKRLRSYHVEIKDYFSNVEAIQLSWLRNFAWGYFGINTMLFFTFLIYNFGLIGGIETPFMVLNVILFISSFYLSFHGIKQYSISTFAYAAQLDVSIEKELVTDTKPKIVSQHGTELQLLFEQIQLLFERDNIYLEPQLQLQDIADRLQTGTHRVSQAMNQLAQKSFFEWVNGYRVKHLQKLLLDPEKKNFTILALGLESGFNSKASLNRIFKQYTGQSPRQFQKSQLPKKDSIPV